MKEKILKEKLLIVVMIALMLAVVSLCGCGEIIVDTGPNAVKDSIFSSQEPEEEKFEILPGEIMVTGDIDKIKILSYEVRTELWSSMSGWYKFANGIIIPSDGDYNRYTVEQMRKYVVNGTAQNIAGETIKDMSIGANFYDSNGKHLTGAGCYPIERAVHGANGNIFEFIISIERPDPRSGEDLSVFDSIAGFSISVTVWVD